MRRLPESNNVYSTLLPPVDLALAERLLKEEFPTAKIGIQVSRYDGARTLHLDSQVAELEGYPESDDPHPAYFLNGGISGDAVEVANRVKSIFHRFQNAGLQMVIEAYDGDNEVICTLPGR